MLALVLLFAPLAPVQVPANWICDDALFNDGVCDCGCDAPDDDCASGEFTDCVRDSGCGNGQVPWEHQNDQCMGSS
ncbi:MAG: hypothetical protein Q8O67_22735, partial [Deltaproteobacteria bacterium]|nr:hypothetical protein [Deltaproteobacteria bacterium]